jgi:2-polyprenyl-3-methyl-5-hydroxy-6-metoxy-1,4-benzoquinol methylase
MQDVNSNQGMFQVTDEQPSARVPEHHRYIWPVVATLLPQKKAQLILDAGCGGGEIACRLAEAGNRVVAVDLSKGKSVPINGSVRYVIRSVEQPLTDLGPFDAIMSIEVIEHLYSPQKAMGNFYEALKPGGTLIMTTNYHGYVKNLALSMSNRWDRHFEATVEGGQVKFFSRKTLNELLRGAGFERLEYRYVGRGPLVWNSIVACARKSVAST